MKTIIHVNQHIIRANNKSEDNNPPLTIKTYKKIEKVLRLKSLDLPA